MALLYHRMIGAGLAIVKSQSYIDRMAKGWTLRRGQGADCALGMTLALRRN
ncbi:hypothetical protein [Mesorhizobium temperatum]|uniref:hypothetical protein n=1 Tax=Mesorhizobium temperatum TaxID=241416 RepID=UPI00142D2A48|nr:hypothetical protein [Mesorhizobium temperatum]